MQHQKEKEEEEKRMLKEEKKRRKNRERIKNKEEEIAKIKRMLKDNPNVLYYPSFISYCNEIPTTCPYDGQELLELNVAKKKIKNGKGICCIYCSRLFLLKDTKQTLRRYKKRTEQSDIIKYKKIDSITFVRNAEDPPISTILSVTLKSNTGNIGYIFIVSNQHNQNSELGIYWVGRALPSIILACILNNENKFKYKDVEYTILGYITFEDTKKYFNIISRFSNATAPQEVYIFAQKNIDHFKSNGYELVTAMIPCKNSTFPVPITVYYEKETSRYFMNEVSYIEARQKYGLPYLKLRFSDGQDKIGTFGWLKKHSELYLLGYSVSMGSGMDTEKRRDLLKEIIDSGVYSKCEVMNHIEWLIKTRNYIDSMENAVREWKSDLEFVSRYDADQQRKIWVTRFKSKYSTNVLLLE